MKSLINDKGILDGKLLNCGMNFLGVHNEYILVHNTKVTLDNNQEVLLTVHYSVLWRDIETKDIKRLDNEKATINDFVKWYGIVDNEPKHLLVEHKMLCS